MKTIYLAGKVNQGEITIASFADELEVRGHRVPLKWWQGEALPKPYLSHMETSRIAAVAMIDAALKSDVTILFPSPDMLGAAVELGAAIASTELKRDKQIIVLAPQLGRQSVFYAHPSITPAENLDDIRGMSWY